jgi:circadian clock protein KaiC
VSPSTATRYDPAPERLQTGIGKLDDMIENGWLRGTSTLVVGASGAGKTMVGLHFLKQGVERGEASLLVNFQESPTQIRRAMLSFGWKPAELIRPGKLDILYTSPVELHIDTIVTELLRRVERDDVRRVTIDALADIERGARDEKRFMDYLYALNQLLAARQVTTMLILEVAMGANHETLKTGKELSYMSDNVLLLSMEFGEDLRRTIRVVKSRGSAHDGRRHTLQIGPNGVSVE